MSKHCIYTLYIHIVFHIITIIIVITVIIVIGLTSVFDADTGWAIPSN